MLVKKVKVVAPDGAEPSTEERYILTVDIDSMATLVGLPSAIVRTAVSDALNNPNATYYGEARDVDYFQYQCNVWENITDVRPRKLELDNIHLRVSERIKTDASDSFLIVPVSVTNPGFVGDLSVGYELIPHIVMEAHTLEDYRKITTAVSIFRPFADSSIAQEIRDPSELVSFRLVGFDLLLCNEVDPGPTPIEYKGSIHLQDGAYRNPNTMIYDFGFGVCLHYEVDHEKDEIKITAYRDSRMLAEPVIKNLPLAGNRVLVEPSATLCSIVGNLPMPGYGKSTFCAGSVPERNPADIAMLSFVLDSNRQGYSGIGWRN